MMETYIGKTISDFTLQSSDGQTISLRRCPGTAICLTGYYWRPNTKLDRVRNLGVEVPVDGSRFWRVSCPTL